jgi:hypothetical protein
MEGLGQALRWRAIGVAMSKLSLPAGAMVMTPLGPADITDVRSGSEVLGVRDGRQAWGTIEKATRSQGPASAIRLLTPGGEVLAASGSQVGTARGLAPADSLRGGDRIELLEPTGLPWFRSPQWQPQGLEGITFALPVKNGCAAVLEPQLLNALQGQEMDFSLEHRDRWMTVKVNRLGESSAWSWDSLADALSLLCAWRADEKGPVELRATLAEGDPVARLLIGALIGAHRRFHLRWTPSFFPVEIRITPGTAQWPAYLPIARVFVEPRLTTELTVAEDHWSAYSGLSLVRNP